MSLASEAKLKGSSIFQLSMVIFERVWDIPSNKRVGLIKTELLHILWCLALFFLCNTINTEKMNSLQILSKKGGLETQYHYELETKLTLTLVSLVGGWSWWHKTCTPYGDFLWRTRGHFPLILFFSLQLSHTRYLAMRRWHPTTNQLLTISVLTKTTGGSRPKQVSLVGRTTGILL